MRKWKIPAALTASALVLSAAFATAEAAQDPTQVKALVYVAAFIPKAGETGAQLDGQFPGSLLGPDATYSVSYPGGADTFVKPADFQAIFAGDRTPAEAAVAAATQLPIEADALSEPVAAGVPGGRSRRARAPYLARGADTRGKRWMQCLPNSGDKFQQSTMKARELHTVSNHSKA